MLDKLTGAADWARAEADLAARLVSRTGMGFDVHAFERLAVLAGRIRTDHPDAVELSAGMSGDLEAAVSAGATIVRVGTALFGDRPLVSE